MKNKNFFVGIFVSFAFVGLLFIVATTFIKSEIFTDWFYVYTKVEDSFGLKSGNDVIMRGQKVGYIKQVFLKKDHVLVEMRIDSKYQDIIAKDCVAELLQKNFVVGDWRISLKQNNTHNQAILENDTLLSNLPIHINKTVEKSTKMVDTVEEILQHVISGQGTLGQLYVDDSILEVLHSFGYNANMALKSGRRFFIGAGQTLKHADTLLQELTITSNKANTVIDSVTILTNHLNNSVKSANKLVDELSKTPENMNQVLDDLDSVIFEMDTVFRALENHWILRRTVKKLKEQK